MEKIIANVECPVIMDEAYMEFADGKEVPPTDMRPLNKLWLVAGSTLSLVGKYSNLMVFRTFSKAYGLAGLRCGYAVGAATDEFRRCGIDSWKRGRLLSAGAAMIIPDFANYEKLLEMIGGKN
jgi:histidinol-phosphate/aromatic aminotransferase/cobyric acid decarboxylase-like protein